MLKCFSDVRSAAFSLSLFKPLPAAAAAAAAAAGRVFSCGRICKNDVGGSQRVLEKHWTSFVKARLNCSVPGSPSLLRRASVHHRHHQHQRGSSVVGVFTTQLNSIPGSAVCAFSMADIEKVFWGRFKEQKTPDSVWTPYPETSCPNLGHGPAASFKSSIEFPDDTCSSSSPTPHGHGGASIGDEPWFTKTRVLAKTTSVSLNDSLLLEEIDVFNRAKCLSNREDDKRVLSLHVDKDSQSVRRLFQLRHPYPAESLSCIASRDPYCGWRPHGACERIQPGALAGYEQDVELGNTAHLGDCHDMEFSSAPVTVQPSGPIHPPLLIPTQSPSSGTGPELYGSGFVLQDDPATSNSLDSIPGGREGKAHREAASALPGAWSDSCPHLSLL
ncbi:hypothetical protein INR49_009927 [Caranx melampygus]|nr:hypothetical protein INR49_009927 [Caranx melampygus]